MRTLKILAISTLAIMAMVALSISVAAAGEGCSAKAAETKTASAACASKVADATVAGAGCASKAAAATTASAGCAAGAAAMPSDLAMEAVRLPSGALAVFYTGETDATIASLHAKAGQGMNTFGCDIAKCLTTNEACNVEVAKTANGIMILATSEKADVLNSYQERYEIAMATVEDESGE